MNKNQTDGSLESSMWIDKEELEEEQQEEEKSKQPDIPEEDDAAIERERQQLLEDVEDDFIHFEFEKERKRKIIDALNEDQSQRYMALTKSVIPRHKVKEILSDTLEHECPGTISILLGGMARIYCGELVEEALNIKQRRGAPENDPLLPSDIREAFISIRHREEQGAHYSRQSSEKAISSNRMAVGK
ncbi:putative hTAFII28-like protein conserved region [Monocercomonoides exilis]|uniref:putative hTAFII28-like protein conserved region n=1 Tax=Monocercomonoides exilis TaxID=2049356 RepID=UPI003559834F|nr:putative hTAFII28-like protein conserved region [Monocercomonoides exilis]|eukprot:MONOS_11499.1-p1 / transcript=MONOS_11499.1 / gene=MONOS_11499 / organism=Monocercomonoides_exilis_PA203 / gene_product=unspecified product / transcript_product=unspecified product / location=Mono_scaffold00580:35242-35996(+) / protein_length=187 / sequence_SO=supercontig / SO=protein_coding / is_pseudo=false